MSLPDFLVVGAMKAGTTSLCSDLAANSEIFFPSVKEPHTLVARSFEKESHYKEYRKLFAAAEKDQLCGEGSTGYTKLHKFGRVPEKARKVIGKKAKILYIVRNPLDRIKSHHYQLYRKGEAKKDINEEVRLNSELVKISKYASQIKPWIFEFGREKVKVLKFERYVNNRKKVLNEVGSFLDIQNSKLKISSGERNKGESHRIPPQTNILKKLLYSQWYKNTIHPIIPSRVKKIVKKLLYSEAPKRPEGPKQKTVSIIKEKLEKEVIEISKIYGCNEVMWKSW
jgi:hypothetical protein